MITMKGNNATYQGDSGDTKPDTVPVNTLFEELDTGDTYYFTGDTWVKVGSVTAE